MYCFWFSTFLVSKSFSSKDWFRLTTTWRDVFPGRNVSRRRIALKEKLKIEIVTSIKLTKYSHSSLTCLSGHVRFRWFDGGKCRDRRTRFGTGRQNFERNDSNSVRNCELDNILEHANLFGDKLEDNFLWLERLEFAPWGFYVEMSDSLDTWKRELDPIANKLGNICSVEFYALIKLWNIQAIVLLFGIPIRLRILTKTYGQFLVLVGDRESHFLLLSNWDFSKIKFCWRNVNRWFESLLDCQQDVQGSKKDLSCQRNIDCLTSLDDSDEGGSQKFPWEIVTQNSCSMKVFQNMQFSQPIVQ